MPAAHFRDSRGQIVESSLPASLVRFLNRRSLLRQANDAYPGFCFAERILPVSLFFGVFG
jgi:hypothetical protein